MRQKRTYRQRNQHRHQHQGSVSPAVQQLAHAGFVCVAGSTVVALIALPSTTRVKEREGANQPEHHAKVLFILQSQWIEHALSSREHRHRLFQLEPWEFEKHPIAHRHERAEAEHPLEEVGHQHCQHSAGKH